MRYVIGCGRMAAVGIMILVILFILLVLFPLVGRKGRDFFRRRGFDVRYEDVVNVLKLLQSADVPRVGLALRIERSAEAR